MHLLYEKLMLLNLHVTNCNMGLVSDPLPPLGDSP